MLRTELKATERSLNLLCSCTKPLSDARARANAKPQILNPTLLAMSILLDTEASLSCKPNNQSWHKDSNFKSHLTVCLVAASNQIGYKGCNFKDHILTIIKTRKQRKGKTRVVFLVVPECCCQAEDIIIQSPTILENNFSRSFTHLKQSLYCVLISQLTPLQVQPLECRTRTTQELT